MEKRWVVLLTVLIVLSLVVNLLYLDALYSIAETIQKSEKGELSAVHYVSAGDTASSEITYYTTESSYDCYDSYAMSLLTKLTSQGKDCVDTQCDSYTKCLKKGENVSSSCMAKECNPPMSCYNAYETGKNNCSKRYLNNQTAYNNCLSPYLVAFNYCIGPYPSWYVLGYSGAASKYNLCSTICGSRGYLVQQDCICDRNTCIISCYEGTYVPTESSESTTTPVNPPWPWELGSYSSDTSSSYYTS